MQNQDSQSFNEQSTLQLKQLPRSTLQALYHSVTGKTETVSKIFQKSVIINGEDVANLNDRMKQQMEHYDLILDPTVTIVVKQSDHRSLRYSSFERFYALRENTQSITSDLIIKYEFIIQLPNTGVHQRCIINISMDSGLPIIDRKNNMEEIEEELFGFFFLGDYPALSVSIDFVDFLVSKNLMNAIEEWFGSLEVVPRSSLSKLAAKNLQTINVAINQFDKIGLSAFVATYAFYSSASPTTLQSVMYGIALAFLAWACFSIIIRYTSQKFNRSIRKGILPAVLLLSAGDDKAWKKYIGESVSARIAFARLLLGFVTGIAINILSSFIYAYMTAPR